MKNNYTPIREQNEEIYMYIVWKEVSSKMMCVITLKLFDCRHSDIV